MEDLVSEPEQEEFQEREGSELGRDLKKEEANEPHELLSPVLFSPDFNIPSQDLQTASETDEERGSTKESEEEDEEEEREIEDEDKESESDDHPAILRIDESLLARVSQIFVEPPGYSRSQQDMLDRITDSYVFIIHGDEHAGKLTCALRLAQDLLARKGAEKRIYCYRRRPDESPSLLDFVRQDYVRKERVYILEDAFPSVSKEDLAPPFLHLLNEKLQEKNSFLILTTENSGGALPAGVATIRAAVSDLKQVFFNHLALYETDEFATDRVRIEKPVRNLAENSWDGLKDKLRDPDQIDEFCRRLGAQGGLPNADGLRTLAQEIALRRIEAARPWFAKLLPHEKLFAFLVVLFPGRDGRSLYEIFLTVVTKLREQGMSLIDCRKIGYNDLLDRVRALEGPTREIGFHERAIGSEVEWQVKNYNHLLWDLVPWFLEEIQKNLGQDGGETRRSRAAAVGRIGLHQPARLRAELKDLARHPAKEVAAATGYAFSEVCLRDRDAEQEVGDALRTWAVSRESRLMWTASSCIWRVYGALKRSERNTTETRSRLLDTLEELITVLEERQPFGDEDWKTAWTIASRNSQDTRAAERQARDLLSSWAKKNRDSALFAIGQIALADPEGMVERLQLWLTSGRPELRQAGLQSIRRLFESAARETGPPRQRHSALVVLIEPVLAHCGEGSRVTAALFNALGKWIDKWPEQPVSAAALAALLKAANRLNGRAARAFRSALSPWLASPSQQVRRYGRALLMRSLLLEGAAVPALESFRGALVLDASTEALGDEGYEPIARRIWNLLQPRLDLRLVRMGDQRRLAEPGELFPSRAILADGSRPRLLLPALEAFDGEDLEAVIVLATGPVLDLEEVSMTAWSGRLLLANLCRASQQLAFPQAIRIDPRSSESGIADLAAKVDDRCAAVLARAGAASSGQQGLEGNLEHWIAELDQPQSLGAKSDRALAVFHTVLGLAESDLERCSAVLSHWLGPDRSDLELRVGSAAVRLLFRMDSYRNPPLASAQTHLFRLATKLGSCGTEALETALATVRRWLTFEEWTETLLGSGGNEPAALPRWIESILPENAELLSRALTDWRRSFGDESAGTARLYKTTIRLEEWIAQQACDPEEPAAPDDDPAPVVQMASPAERRQESPPPYTTDPLGFPMVWLEEIGAFMHWLPVTKIQFERFIANAPDLRFDDAWYHRVLDLNPRVAIPEIGPDNYWSAFVTGILPEEARRFAAWCGREYALPTSEEWQKAYAALAAARVSPNELVGLIEGAGELVRSVLTQVDAASALADRPEHERTRADQMLMRLGVLEWVEHVAGAVPWVGMGEPSPHFRMLWSIGKGPAIPLDVVSSRSSVFGFRLIRRPA